jgi:pilus assembly protein CpaF
MPRETVQIIAERARSLLSTGPESIDQAISRAVDEAFEGGQDLASQAEVNLIGEVKSSLSGYGQLDNLIANPEIEEIWINAPDKLFV